MSGSDEPLALWEQSSVMRNLYRTSSEPGELHLQFKTNLSMLVLTIAVTEGELGVSP